MTAGRVVARWESRSGKYFAEVIAYAEGTYGYRGADCAGWRGEATEVDAVAYVQQLIDRGGYFAPDSHVTRMRRVTVAS